MNETGTARQIVKHSPHELLAENARLAARVIELEQTILVAAQWCPDGACEFAKLRFKAPAIEDGKSA